METDINEAVRNWQDKAQESADFSAVSSLVLQRHDRRETSCQIRVPDGSKMLCVARPISGGATLVTFAAKAEASMTARELDLTAKTAAL